MSKLHNVLGSHRESGKTLWAKRTRGDVVDWGESRPEPQFTQEAVEEILRNPPWFMRDLARETWGE